jgi:hypothetical protein
LIDQRGHGTDDDRNAGQRQGDHGREHDTLRSHKVSNNKNVCRDVM